MIKSVCVIGYKGRMGKLHSKRFREEHPDIHLSGFDTGTLELKTDGVCPDADAYIIATPSDTHYEITKRLLNQNKHVLVEKPLAMEYEQAEELYWLAIKKGVTLLVSHTQRYNPVFIFNSPYFVGAPRLGFYSDMTQEGDIKDAVFDIMIHQLELAMFLTKQDWVAHYGRPTLNDDIITTHIRLGTTDCELSVSYGSPNDLRVIIGNNYKLDLTQQLPDQKDALYRLHNRFLNLCETGDTPDDISFAVGAVKAAEHIQKELFG